MAYSRFHTSLKLVLAIMPVNYGAHSQTAQSPPTSPIVVPRPDIEAVVQAMSTKTCAGIVSGREKQASSCTMTRQSLIRCLLTMWRRFWQ